MINLLKTTLPEDAIVKILESALPRPVLPPLGSSVWSRVSENPIVQKLLGPLHARAETERIEPLPVLTDALYAEYHLTGVRRNFEIPYFERRRRLARAAICALTDGEAATEKWIPSLTSKLDDILHEASWAVPAHVTHESGRDPLMIDLFCAETANLMGEMLAVFGSALPDELKQEIRDILDTRIFDNFINRNGEFWWTRGHNNWNAVCHQGVIGAALTVDENPVRVARMLVLACESLPLYLSGFGADGSTSEGPGYWDYGFGWFAMLNEQLEARTGGGLSLFEEDDKIRQIAKFGPRISLPFHNFVNFADSGPTGNLRPSTLAYLGERLQDDDCLTQAGINYRYVVDIGLNLDAARLDFFYLARLILRCPEDVSGAIASPPEDFYFRDLGVIIAHCRDEQGALLDFAAKAGNNNEHHNHNDCGSYILNINGTRMITEIGAPEYVRDFFNEHRYEFLAARTLGHSLPIINGCEQAGGREFEAEVVKSELSGNTVLFSVDATRCYPPEAGCLRFIRQFHLDKSVGRLEVCDEFELKENNPVETAICTDQAAVRRDAWVDIEAVNGTKLRIIPMDGTLVDRIETHTYSNHAGAAAEIRRIVLIPEKSTRKTELRYAVLPESSAFLREVS